MREETSAPTSLLLVAMNADVHDACLIQFRQNLGSFSLPQQDELSHTTSYMSDRVPCECECVCASESDFILQGERSESSSQTVYSGFLVVQFI